MTVQAILQEKGTDVVVIAPDTTMAAAAELLIDQKIGAVLVTEKSQIEGILSERDIVRAFAAQGGAIAHHPVKSYMTREVIICQPGDTVDQVMAAMTNRRVRHIPVMQDGQLAGIVSIGDVVKRRIRDAEVEVESLKVYVFSGR